jgi:hypothetical protein
VEQLYYKILFQKKKIHSYKTDIDDNKCGFVIYHSSNTRAHLSMCDGSLIKKYFLLQQINIADVHYILSNYNLEIKTIYLSALLVYVMLIIFSIFF